MGPQLTATGTCTGPDAARHQNFCRDYDAAQRAYYGMRWAEAGRLAKAADQHRSGYKQVGQLIAAADAALKDDEAGPYNFRLGDCPARIGINTRNDWFQLLRCGGRPHVSGELALELPATLNAARTVLNEEPVDPIARASYVNLCALAAQEHVPGDATRWLDCLWHAEQSNPERLRVALTRLSPSERSVSQTHVDDARAALAKTAARWPAASPERTVMMDTPTRILVQHERDQRNARDPLSVLARMHRELDAGKGPGLCSPALRKRLETHLKGVKPKFATLQQRLADAPGPLITEGLAQCHYAGGHVPSAAAALHTMRGLHAGVTFAEKVYLAQVAAVVAQRSVGLKVENLKEPRRPLSQREAEFYAARADFEEAFTVIRGVVRKLEPVGARRKVIFKKKRLRLSIPECRSGAVTIRALPDGRIKHSMDCSVVKQTQTQAPEPVVVDDGRGLEPGRYVELLVDGTGVGAVSLIASKPGGRVLRLGDAVLNR